MNLLQTILLAIVQGISELFPVSSVAHAVLTPWAFGWQLSPEFLKQHFLPVVVLLHLGTAVALLLYFRSDWLAYARAIVSPRDGVARRELLLVLIGTVPAAVLGLVFEKMLKGMFANVTFAAIFLIANGFVLFFGERVQRGGSKQVADLRPREALAVGLAQSLALIPGFSRSGASMVAGFWAGLSHAAAARFSMLLATPIIVGASVLELPKLARQADAATLQQAVIGGLVAGVVAYLSVTALMRWFKRHEINAMRPFALYCWVVGALVLGLTVR
ncbi:undecaprenyl-diphosphatase [Andreprevotia lacus DSM 23236]|jgi:undecaprenyl-diphosphatase|uniref:Undecaprenyl-diphosphatase n=1 Tax=Andreprevotia lacus DSM 23236 TaxID=1121001 RepID=A0A1W1XWL6_9NEIS|nr:undecaprenyl-diphosphate phosphatase [Andreprevotia lacus]SMC27921.1 undecaprenyl-diphosphatase [Andreprevotia lacus DSM 23236]